MSHTKKSTLQLFFRDKNKTAKRISNKLRYFYGCNSLFYFNIVAAGIIQDRLMSKNELTEFSKLPNLEVARSQLCSVLQSAGSCLVGQLNQSQNILVSHLESHLQLQKSPDQPKEVKESNE